MWENIEIKQDTDHVMPQHKPGKLAPKPFAGSNTKSWKQFSAKWRTLYLMTKPTSGIGCLGEHPIYPQGTEEQENN